MHAPDRLRERLLHRGEMVTALKNVWGEFQQPVVF